ncbi:MAG: SNF2-related protein [Myxococcota bacterium]
MSLHPIQRRWQAEDLMRRRRSDERRRYAAPQRAGRIDPNPHQIEAVIFALSRLADGGCILADEVGLGKTIEAGLVIAQLRAEGAQRILLIAPKSLLGQWRQELSTLFGIDTLDASTTADLTPPGVYLVGREAAGGVNGQARLKASGRFDLVVIDEAHELFSGLHKRFDRSGGYSQLGKSAQLAARVFELIQETQTPVLLLTATPIQNSLAELWALVRFVDPAGTLLGDLTTFRGTFCDRDDRVLVEGQEDQLRRRISVVLRRTLRRQAKEFLAVQFVPRKSNLYEYEMLPEERALYEEVTKYLLRPRLAAFEGNQRRLLLIQFQRRMASSTAALASSLDKVAYRLERMRRGEYAPDEAIEEEWQQDLDDVDPPELEDESESAPDDMKPLSPEAIAAELAEVRRFAERARGLGLGSKAKAMLRAVEAQLRRVPEGSGKVVLFTESVVTQEHLRDLLIQEGVAKDEEITLFRGQNDGERAKQAHQRWWNEVGSASPPHNRPAPDVARRQALVHEFKTRSKIFISTEAGAKGLNLQFCDTIINYDLPWNPQRIEQRIGRCHRYGQTRDVRVINFLAADNETERLIFEILSQKLELFGTVLDASDAILHSVEDGASDVLASTIGAEVEPAMRRAFERARSVEDITHDVRALRDEIEVKKQRFQDEQARTAVLISTYLDEDVRARFKQRKEELPAALEELDHELARLVREYLHGDGIPFQEEARVLTVPAHPALPVSLAEGTRAMIGRGDALESLHISHPLVVAAVGRARALDLRKPISIELPEGAPAALLDRRGGAARLVGVLVRHEGLEPVDHLLAVAVFEGESEPLPPALARQLLSYTMRPVEDALEVGVEDSWIEDAIEEAIFVDRGRVSEEDASRFDRGLEQIEAYVEDRLFLLRRERAGLEDRQEKARTRREKALSGEDRSRADGEVVQLAKQIEKLTEEIEQLERREDTTYERCKQGLYQRKYARPKFERLFDVGILVE